MTIYINPSVYICNDCGKPTSVNLDFCLICGNRKVQVVLPAKGVPASRPTRLLEVAA